MYRLTENECLCGSKCFEDIDVTPEGIEQRRYFTRCVKCGLVISTHGCGTNPESNNAGVRLGLLKFLRGVYGLLG